MQINPFTAQSEVLVFTVVIFAITEFSEWHCAETFRTKFHPKLAINVQNLGGNTGTVLSKT
jgi:hypothetical protein